MPRPEPGTPAPFAPFLRQIEPAVPEWAALVETARRELAEAGNEDSPARLRALGRLHEGLRARGEADEAAAVAGTALALARRLNDRPAEVAALIRLATAEQYAGRHADAIRHFNDALALIDAHGVERYRDFAHQHLGKCLVEIGRLDEAIGHFERARAHRLEHGGPIESTEQALTAARELHRNDPP